MNKLYKLLLIFIIIISGCKNQNLENKKINQVIDNFDMNIYSTDGKKLFSIKSPSSSYESNSNIFNLEETTINLFKNNKTEYIINSDNSKLSNNELLELKGNVLVISTLKQSDKLYANSFKWNINNEQYILTGNVKFENKTIILNSNKAILNKTNNIIEFFNPVKYKIKDSNNESSYEVNSENAYYNIDTKSVIFRSKEERVRSKIYF